MEKNKKYTQGVEDVERVIEELNRQEMFKKKGIKMKYSDPKDPDLEEDEDDDAA